MTAASSVEACRPVPALSALPAPPAPPAPALLRMSIVPSSSKSDVFPITLQTWIDRELDRGETGRQAVNRHLMDTYAEPLRIYFLGTNMRWLGEAEDVIDGFFAHRLGQPMFLANWRASGLRLRRWLMTALCLYLKELRKQRMRDGRAREIVDDPLTFAGDANKAMDRAAATAFIRQAMRQAEAHLAREGCAEHWLAFVRHHVEDESFRDIGAALRVTEARAAVMSRTAARHFRAALRDVLLRDGTAPDRIDDEIQSLLEATES